jgi:hypothetical protein
MKPGATIRVRFREGIPIRFWQDFNGKREPLPSDRWFQGIVGGEGTAVRLRAHGYGDHGGPGSYGNGAIYVQLHNKPKEGGRG